MKYRRAKQTAWRTIGEETILLDLAEKRMLGLNPTAAFIWQTFETMTDVDAVVHALGAKNQRLDAEDQLSLTPAEVETFLEELVELGLVQRAEPTEPQRIAIDPPAELKPPRILWQETVEQVAATCAFFPAQNPLCSQVPFS